MLRVRSDYAPMFWAERCRISSAVQSHGSKYRVVRSLPGADGKSQGTAPSIDSTPVVTPVVSRRWHRTGDGMKNRKHNERGVAAVEMAIVLPIFVLLLIGMIEFGVILHDNLVLQNAAREGARVGAI